MSPTSLNLIPQSDADKAAYQRIADLFTHPETMWWDSMVGVMWGSLGPGKLDPQIGVCCPSDAEGLTGEPDRWLIVLYPFVRRGEIEMGEIWDDYTGADIEGAIAWVRLWQLRYTLAVDIAARIVRLIDDDEDRIATFSDDPTGWMITVGLDRTYPQGPDDDVVRLACQLALNDLLGDGQNISLSTFGRSATG